MSADLRSLRTKRGLKLNEAAKLTGVSQTVLRMLEDKVIKPTEHELRLICDAYAKPDPAKTEAVMRPSATLNAALQTLGA